jgi:hypothetical protein
LVNWSIPVFRNCVVVNGFFPSLTVKQILNSITSELLEADSTFASPNEQVAPPGIDFTKLNFGRQLNG